MTAFESRLIHALLAAALLAAAPATARTYKWVDASGQTHYSERMPADASIEVTIVDTAPTAEPAAAPACADLACRFDRLQSQNAAHTGAEANDDAAKKKAAGAYPAWPTPVEETDEEKIARLVAECKRSRGADCDSDREKRRMLLNNVELTQAERRALRGLSPAVQRRVLLERIPKRYRDID